MLKKEKMGMLFECPHCDSDNFNMTRISSPDDMTWMTENTEMKELWQCDACAEYAIFTFKLDKIEKLIRSGGA